MTGFTIDDVRETMGPDITSRLAHIELTARAVLLSPPLARSIENGSPPPRFRAIADASHAIFGTSSLVHADSLSSTAQVLERLAEQAERELEHVERHAALARRFARLFEAAAAEMRTMLTLELEAQGDEAQWLAVSWKEQAEELELLASSPAEVVPTFPPQANKRTDGGIIPLFAMKALLEPAAPSVAAPAASPSVEDVEDDDLWLDLESIRPQSGSDVGPEKKGTTPSAETPEHFAFLDETAAQPSPAVGDDVWLADEDVLADRGPSGQPDARGPQAATDGATEFAFFDQEGAAKETAQITGGAFEDELKAIFQQEARESLIALQGYVHGLAAEPDNAGLARPLERIYHTLKGASATVGLQEVSELAAKLQYRMEEAVDQVAPITTAFSEELVADTNQLLHSVGLPPLMLSPQAPIDAAARRPELEEAHSDFLLEARQLFQEAAKAIDELASELEAGHSRNESLDELGSMFHRMKGSALVVGEDAVAAVAASLEVQCSDEAAPTIAELSQGLARIAVMLGLGATPARGGADEADVRRHFLEEARRLCNEAEALTNQLPGQTRPWHSNFRASSARCFTASRVLLPSFQNRPSPSRRPPCTTFAQRERRCSPIKRPFYRDSIEFANWLASHRAPANLCLFPGKRTLRSTARGARQSRYRPTPSSNRPSCRSAARLSMRSIRPSWSWRKVPPQRISFARYFATTTRSKAW